MIVSPWYPEWDELPEEERARLRARQGAPNIISQPLCVVAPDGSIVERDGATMGELWLRGNNVTLGYFRDEEQTAISYADGWFRTGDLAVWHPDGMVELRDRSKDIIISGGENISSIEVEQVLAAHPSVAEAAVIAGAHPMGRGACCLRDPPRGSREHGGGADRLVPGSPGSLQGPQEDSLLRPSQDQHGEDREVRAA